MNDHHLATAISESEQASFVCPFETWASKAEALLGHSLDGTQWIDGYSLDDARVCFESEFSVPEYVRRVQHDKDALARGELITVISEKSMRAHNEDGDESRWDDIVLYVGKATDKFIEEYVEERFPAEHCQHAHDCCGHWYANTASFRRHGDLVLLKQSYTLNI